MKKRILIFASLIVVVMFIYAYVKNSRLTSYAKDLEIYDTSKLIAIASITNYNEAYDKYLKIDYKVIDATGEELYVIYPLLNNSKINIYKAELDGESNLVKKDLIVSTNKPFILNCNISDIIPNTILEIEYNNKKYEYSPSISLKDGSISVLDYVWEIKK